MIAVYCINTKLQETQALWNVGELKKAKAPRRCAGASNTAELLRKAKET